METVEIPQEELSNIARMSFLRGKIAGLRGLQEYFLVFESKFISKEDLIESIEQSIVILQEGLC